MRVYAVTPIHVGPEELVRRQARYDALTGPSVRVELHDVGPSAPPALETAQDVRDSEGLVTEALRAAPEGYDALMPDCVLDPGVPQLAGTLGVPVIGLLRTSLGYEVLLGRTAGVVARNDAIATELADRVALYGWSGSLTGVEVLDLDVAAIADHDRWLGALGTTVRRMGGAGATAVVNGCSAVDVPGRLAGVRMVDPTAQALHLVAAGEAA